MRAAIYARYSTEMQSDRSIEDQFALCEAYAAREGLTVVARFEDRARSGGSTMGRDGLAGLMRAAATNAFDVVVVEALDRISRDMEDLSGIYKRLNFAGIMIRAVHDGEINTVLVGLRGVIGQVQREDAAQKTRRGMAGRAQNGLIASGLSYGYKTVPGQPGRRVIDEAQAAIVRRIFREYIDGASTLDIARRLNAEGISAPRGAFWRPATLKSSCALPSGILQNEIYIGRFIWGRARNSRNPDTGRLVQRNGSEAAKVVTEIPELAILSMEEWTAAQAAMTARRAAPFASQRKASFLLSGLLKCGCCGGGLISNGRDRNWRRRIRCVSITDGRICTSRQTILLDQVQNVVIEALRKEMSHPEVIGEFVRTYHDERRRLAADEGNRRASLQKRITELTRERDRLIDCIANGHGDPAVLGPRSTAAHKEVEALKVELAAQPEPLNVIALHPAALKRYEQMLANLPDNLEASKEAIREPLCELIERIDVHSQPGKGALTMDITGRLNVLLGLSPSSSVWGRTLSRTRIDTSRRRCAGSAPRRCASWRAFPATGPRGRRP
jgi:site-specific DNA recombinase